MKKKYLIFYFIIAGTWMLLFASNGSAVVYPASDYVSLYDYSKTYYYTNSAGATGMPSIRTGYRYQYDLNDPIIRCGQEVGTCPMPASYNQMNREDGELSRFKVYIAPGTTGIDLSIYLFGQGSRYVAVARLGQPPQNDYGYINSLSDQDYFDLSSAGFQLSDLQARDCIGRNNAGILLIAAGGVTVAREADGGWLYVLLMHRAGSVLANIYNNQVNSSQFMTWFGSVDWAAFGDAGSIVNPTPTPTPPPITDCIFGCDNNSHCVNGQCVPNSPVPTPTPTPGVCVDSLCSLSGGTCLNGKCVIGSSLKVGAESGLVQASLAADQVVELLINSTNSHGDTPVYEWLPLTATIGGNQIPLYVISDKGIFDLNQVLADLYTYTFSFKAGVTSIGKLSMSDLGLQAGDTVVYGYAYQKQSGGIVVDNIVIITVK